MKRDATRARGLSKRFLLLAACLAAALAFAYGAVAAPFTDGPYVVSLSDGAWSALSIEDEDGAPRVVERRLNAQRSPAGQVLSIPAVGKVSAFKVRVRPHDRLAQRH